MTSSIPSFRYYLNNITIPCISGLYKELENGTTPICKPKWGDGIRAGNEVCDDGNKLDGDGCSSTWSLIEEGYTCKEGESSTPDIWSENTKNKDLPSDTKGLQVATLVAAGGSAAMNVISSSMSNPSPNSTFSLVNQIQLLLLLLWLPAYLPLKVIDYIRSLAMSLIEFNIDWSFIFVFKKMINWFDYEQPSDQLYITGVTSGSAFINMADTIAILLSIGVFHLLILLIYVAKVKGRKKLGCSWKLLVYIFKSLTFGFYFRLVFESFLMLWLSSFSEINRFINDESNKYNSSITSIVICIMIVMFIIFILVSTIISSKRKKQFLQKELFDGMKTNKKSKFYSFMFLSRRAALWIILACKSHLYNMIYSFKEYR